MSKKETVSVEAIEKMRDQAKGFLDSGFYYAAADLYNRLLEFDPDDHEAHLYVLISKNKCKDEDALLKHYQDLYSERVTEKKIACEANREFIDKLAEDYYLEDRLEKEEIRRECYFDLTYDSCLSSRIDQKKKILDLIEKDEHLIYLRDHGFDLTDRIIRAYDQRLDEAIENDEINADRICKGYREFLCLVRDKVRSLYRKAKDEEEAEFNELINRYERAKEVREVENLIRDFEAFKGPYEKEHYIALCKEKIQSIIEGEELSARQIEKMLDHAEGALERGRFDDAYENYRKIIDMNVERQEAYLGILKAQNRIADTDKLFDYYKNLYNDEHSEILKACEEDKQHIDEMVDKYYMPDYLEKEEIRAAYYYDLSYRSNLNHRREEENRFRQQMMDNPYLNWLRLNGSKEIRRKIESVYDAYHQRIEDAKKEDERKAEQISNDYRRFLFNTYSSIRKKYQAADENKDKEYRRLIKRIDEADTENKLRGMIVDLKAFGEYKDIGHYISLCQKKIDEIIAREERKETDREIRSLLDEGRTALERGRMERAQKCFSDILALDGEEPHANLGLLMIEVGVKNEEELTEYYKDLYSEKKTVRKDACDVDLDHIDEACDHYVIPGYLDREMITSCYRFDRSFESESDGRYDQKDLIKDEFKMNPYLSKAMKRADDQIRAFRDAVMKAYDERIEEAEDKDEARKKSISEIYQYYLKQSDLSVAELYQKKLKKKEEDDEKKYQENIRRFSRDLSDSELQELIEQFDPDYRDSADYIRQIKARIAERYNVAMSESLNELSDKGDELIKEKQYDLAEKAFSSYLRFDEGNEDVYIKLLMAQNRVNDVDGLFEYLKELYSERVPIRKEALEIDWKHVDEICEKYTLPGKIEKEDIINRYDFDPSYESLYECRLDQKEKMDELVGSDPSLLWLSAHGSQKIKERIADLLHTYEYRLRRSKENDEEKIREIRKKYEDFLADADKEVREVYLDLSKEKAKTETVVKEVKKEEKKEKIKAPEKKKEEKKEKPRKEADSRMPAFLAIAAVILIAAFGVMYYMRNIRQINQYDTAMALAEEGRYDEAIAIFEKLGNYKESVYYTKQMTYMKASDLFEKGMYNEALELFLNLRFNDSEERVAEIQKILASNAKTGDTIFLGSYEQDGDESNGKELIEWIVADTANGRILLVSKDALEVMAFSEKSDDISWENSSIRSWLNGAFINDAFTKDEQDDIIQTTLMSSQINAEEGSEDMQAGLQRTRDKIFLLSAEDLESYFPEATSRTCVLSAQAAKSGIKTGPNGACNWWLRSLDPEKGWSIQTVSGVDGSVMNSSYEFKNAVRPAMWIKSN